MTDYEYYKRELNRVETAGDYTAKIKITDGRHSTRHLDINKDSAQALVDWLKERNLINEDNEI